MFNCLAARETDRCEAGLCTFSFLQWMDIARVLGSATVLPTGEDPYVILVRVHEHMLMSRSIWVKVKYRTIYKAISNLPYIGINTLWRFGDYTTRVKCQLLRHLLMTLIGIFNRQHFQIYGEKNLLILKFTIHAPRVSVSHWEYFSIIIRYTKSFIYHIDIELYTVNIGNWSNDLSAGTSR